MMSGIKVLSLEDVTGALSVNKVFLQIQPKGSYEQNSTYHGNKKMSVFMPPPIDAKGQSRIVHQADSADQQQPAASLVLQSMMTAIASALGVHVNPKWMAAASSVDINIALTKIAESEKCTLFVIHQKWYFKFGDFPASITVQKKSTTFHVHAKKGESSESVLQSQGYIEIIKGPALKLKKVKELQEIAVICNISLDGGGKKKLKAELVLDIESYFKNLNTTLLD